MALCDIVWYFCYFISQSFGTYIINWQIDNIKWFTISLIISIIAGNNNKHYIFFFFLCYSWVLSRFVMNTSKTIAYYTGWVKKKFPSDKIWQYCTTSWEKLNPFSGYWSGCSCRFVVQKLYWSIKKCMSYQRLKTKDEFCSNTRFAFQ